YLPGPRAPAYRLRRGARATHGGSRRTLPAASGRRDPGAARLVFRAAAFPGHRRAARTAFDLRPEARRSRARADDLRPQRRACAAAPGALGSRPFRNAFFGDAVAPGALRRHAGPARIDG